MHIPPLPTPAPARYASAIVHPLARCLDSQHDDLRKEAADVVAVLGDALGPDLAIFLPLLRKTMARHKMHHPKFEEVAARMLERAPYVEGPNGGTHLHAYAASSANSDAASNADAEDQLIPAFTPLQPLKVRDPTPGLATTEARARARLQADDKRDELADLSTKFGTRTRRPSQHGSSVGRC